MEYDPNRTLEGFKNLVLTSQDPFMRRELWPEYAKLANRILKTSKDEGIRNFTVTPNYDGMIWLMQHTVEYEWSYFRPEDYHNGGNFGGRFAYRDVLGHESSWAVLEVGDISGSVGLYAKIKCCNPQDPKIPLRPYVPEKPKSIFEPEPEPEPEPENDEWSYSPTTRSRSLLDENNQEPVNLNLPSVTTKTVVDWGKVATIGGISVGVAGLGILAYNLLKPGASMIDGTPQDGQPVGP